MWLDAFLMGGVVVNIATYLETWSDGSEVASTALIGIPATAPAVPILVDRVVMGFWDDGVVLGSVVGAQMISAMTHGGERGWVIAKLWLGMLAAAGVVLVGAGVHQHWSYRRLERRLAALKRDP